MTVLKKALAQNDYYFSQTIEKQFSDYLNLLQTWNKVFNLTAITQMDEMVWLHILDSLSINPYLKKNRIIDVGTGAGLPGIPLAIINPDKHFVLLDSNGKKTRFLTQAKMELGLHNIEVLHARCEDFNPLQKFDTIVSRAFSSIQVMLARTKHLLSPAGVFVAMKGVYPEKELKEIPKAYHYQVTELQIKGLDAKRHVVCIQKEDI